MIVDVTKPYNYARFVDNLNMLQQDFPFIEVMSVGNSVLGKDIYAVKIGSGASELHYNGAFHANEWITSLLLMTFIEDCAKALQTNRLLHGHDMRSLFAATTLWIVPMVNPDGVDLVVDGLLEEHPYFERLLQWNGGSFDFSQWKANIRGVDLNDQFPACWEVERERRATEGPSPRDYVGEAPLCEPEAKALYDFTCEHDFQLVMAFHTQGEEIYWNYNDFEPSYAELMAERLAAVCDYKAVKLTGSDAGYKDWFIQQYGRPGFTIEAGLGSNPLPLSHFSIIYGRLIHIMIAGLDETLSFAVKKG